MSALCTTADPDWLRGGRHVLIGLWAPCVLLRILMAQGGTTCPHMIMSALCTIVDYEPPVYYCGSLLVQGMTTCPHRIMTCVLLRIMNALCTTADPDWLRGRRHVLIWLWAPCVLLRIMSALCTTADSDWLRESRHVLTGLWPLYYYRTWKVEIKTTCPHKIMSALCTIADYERPVYYFGLWTPCVLPRILIGSGKDDISS